MVDAFVRMVRESNAAQYEFSLRETRTWEIIEDVRTQPHIFVSRRNPLATRKRAALSDLADLPRLTFDQGADDSFHFSEDILSTLSSAREIRVSDRATIFNLMIGLDGYTISTGIISGHFDPEIIAVPLEVDERIEVGWIRHSSIPLTEQADRYLALMKEVVAQFDVELIDSPTQ